MKRVLFGFGIAVLVAGSQVTFGQPGGNPFIDHSDTGETVHVLPAPAAIHSPRDTQPTDAPPSDFATVYPPSYGSGNLILHQGPQIPGAGFFQVYFGTTLANSTTGLSLNYTSFAAEIDGFVNNFSGTAVYNKTDLNSDYAIIQQYGTAGTPISYALFNAGNYADPNPPSVNKLSDSQVQSYLSGLFDAHKITYIDANTIYGIYFPAGVKIQLQGGTSCSAFCGYHGHFTYGTTDIKYAVFPYTNCRACSLSGKSIVDILTIVTSHEIREAVTDPDLNSWYDSAGYEADDKCAWHNLYRMNKGGFWVQPEYSNGGTSTYPGPGCVVPSTQP